jgi:hypothetical protein
METHIDIPAPEPGDSETVVSMLETAAVFGAKGDAAEALRWLQRAAETAATGNDDTRTLALAQTAANLKNQVYGATRAERGPPPPPSRAPAPPSRAPAPPSRAPSPANGSAGADDERPFLLESRAVVQGSRPPAGAPEPRTSTPPPPPSARARPPVTNGSANGSANGSPKEGTIAAQPAPPRATPSPPVTRPTPASGTPIPAGTAGAKTSVTPAPPATSARPAPKSVTPSVLGAPPAAALAQSRHEVASESAATDGTPRRARQAARVSITKSLTERGLYFVRVLDEGQAPPDDAIEGVLVSNDPNVTLV